MSNICFDVKLVELIFEYSVLNMELFPSFEVDFRM